VEPCSVAWYEVCCSGTTHGEHCSRLAGQDAWISHMVMVTTGSLLLTGIRNTKQEHRLRTSLSQAGTMPLLPPWTRPWLGWPRLRRTQLTQLCFMGSNENRTDIPVDGPCPAGSRRRASVAQQPAQTLPDREASGRSTCARPARGHPGTGRACSFLTSAPFSCATRNPRIGVDRASSS